MSFYKKLLNLQNLKVELKFKFGICIWSIELEKIVHARYYHIFWPITIQNLKGMLPY